MNWAVVIIFVILIIIGIAINASPITLKNKFVSAGTLRGRSKAEIIALVGRPTSVSGADAGKTLLQWMDSTGSGSYHIALLFDQNDICEGVTHEFDST